MDEQEKKLQLKVNILLADSNQTASGMRSQILKNIPGVARKLKNGNKFSQAKKVNNKQKGRLVSACFQLVLSYTSITNQNFREQNFAPWSTSLNYTQIRIQSCYV